MSDELQYQDHPADPRKYLPIQIWHYHVEPKPRDPQCGCPAPVGVDGHCTLCDAPPAGYQYEAQQSLNGVLLKATRFDSEEQAQSHCKWWSEQSSE